MPPLAVVGVCLGAGAGTLVFAVLGYAGESNRAAGRSSRRFRTTLAVLLTIPLVAATVATYLIGVWAAEVKQTATRWVSPVHRRGRIGG